MFSSKRFGRSVTGVLVWMALFGYQATNGQDIVQKTIKVDGKNISYSLLESAGPTKGILLLLPGKGESPKAAFKRSSIPAALISEGYTTLIPNLKYTLFADGVTKEQLREILRVEGEAHSKPDLVIGGFSAGGAVAMSYAEFILSQGQESKLKGLFVIDPPLDLQRLYATSRKMRKYDCSLAQSEGQQTIDFLDKALGGSPDDQYNNYVANSPFMASEADGGNAKWLKDLPVRLYTEPDIAYVRQRQCSEIEEQDLNVNDLQKLYKELRESGSDRCELIVTKGRGYHSWNIADPDELAAWVRKLD